MDTIVKILHIEDDPADARLCRELLETELGIAEIHISPAATLRSGLERLRSEPFDLVVLDLGLPDGEGIELIQRIRRAAPGVPVVALSGTVDSLSALEAVSEGAQDYVSKDQMHVPGLLRRAIRYALERHRMTQHLQERARELASELLASESRFRRLAEMNVIGIVAGRLDVAGGPRGLDGAITDANQAFLDLTGLDRTALPIPMDRISPPGSPLLDQPLLDRLARTGAIAPIERELRHRSGRTCPVLLGAAMIEGSDEFLGWVLDLSEQKEQEGRLRQKENELRQAQKMEEVGKLAGGVAHEFNNMLQAILGYSSLVLDALDPQSRSRLDLEEVIKAGKRAANLTRQLLAFSRKETLERDFLDLSGLVKGMMKMLRPLLGEHVQVVLELADGAGPIHGDRGMLEQVLLNLCVNARDAMPSGGTISVSTGLLPIDQASRLPQRRSGSWARLRVRDTGTGIPPEIREHIFEPFFTTKEANKGTGLGLATVHGIVQQHEGIIAVQSSLGEGTTFEILLPIAHPEEQALAVVLEEPKVVPHGAGTILVAEDEETVRHFLVRILEGAGYRVLAASDGSEAARLFSQHAQEIDIVLLDAVLPGLTGSQVYETIDAVRPGTPVIFSSGYDPDSSRVVEQLVARGMKLIRKPYDQKLLLETVAQILTGA